MEEPKYITYNSNPGTNTFREDLPNATAVLVLGILSIIFAGLIGIILAIIALNMSGNARSLYHNNPDAYTDTSYSKVNAGRICAIVGLCLVAVLVSVILAIVIFTG